MGKKYLEDPDRFMDGGLSPSAFSAFTKGDLPNGRRGLGWTYSVEVPIACPLFPEAAAIVSAKFYHQNSASCVELRCLGVKCDAC